MGNLGSYFL